MDHLARAIVDSGSALKHILVGWTDGIGNVLTGEEVGLWASIAKNVLSFFAELSGEIAKIL